MNMASMQKSPLKKITMVLSVVIVVALLATWLSSLINATPKQTMWRPTQSQLSWFNGPMYALSQTLPIAYPKTPIQLHKRWHPEVPDTQEDGFDMDKPRSAKSTMAIAASVASLEDESIANVFDWVAQGNHLMLPYQKDNDSITQILKQLGIQAIDVQKPKSSNDADIRQRCQIEAKQRQALINRADVTTHNSDQDVQNTLKRCYASLNRVTLNQEPLFFYSDANGLVRFESLKKKNKSVLNQSTGANGSQWITLRYGQGSLTFISDMQMFDNPIMPQLNSMDLSRYDHMEIANMWLLPASEVILTSQLENHNEGMPLVTPDWLRLLRFAPLFVALMVLATILLFWHYRYPRGVRHELPKLEQRQWLMHLSGAGEFIQRTHAKEAMLQQWQDDLFIQLQKRFVQWPYLSTKQRVALLRKTWSISPLAIDLWCQPIPNRIHNKDWLTYLKAHQQIKKVL